MKTMQILDENKNNFSDVITICDEEMICAMRLVAERMKLVVEASAGAAVAAALKINQR